MIFRIKPFNVKQLLLRGTTGSLGNDIFDLLTPLSPWKTKISCLPQAAESSGDDLV